MAVARETPRAKKKVVVRRVADDKSAKAMARPKVYKRAQRTAAAKDTKGADLARGQKAAVPVIREQRIKHLRRVREPLLTGKDISNAVTYVASGGTRNGTGKARRLATVPSAGKQTAAVVGSLTARLGADAPHKAPVLKVLDQTTRVSHAIAGAEKAVIEGVKPRKVGDKRPGLSAETVGKAALRGLLNKDKYGGSDVIRATGYKGPGISTLGTISDIASDPLTYTGAGVGTVAEKTALKLAAKAAKQTGTRTVRTAAQVTRKEAAREMTRTAGVAKPPSLAERAAARTTGDQRRGLVVKFAGKEVPGIRTATAKAPKPRKAVRKIKQSGVGQGVRHAVADVNPNIGPAGVPKRAAKDAAQHTRAARAEVSQGRRQAEQVAVGIQKKIGEENYGKVIDALEAGTVKSLPAELQQAARTVRSHFRYVRRVERRAGIATPNHANYVPHAPVKYLKGGHGIVEPAAEVTIGAAKTGKKATLEAAKGRTVRGTIAHLRETKPGEYSEDLPLLYANRMASGKTAVARASLLTKLADSGRRLKPGQAAPDLRALEANGEGVYHLASTDEGFHLRPVKDAKALDRVKSGKLVILNRELVDRAVAGVTPTLHGPGIVRGLDKTQALFKRVALATPGFHIRNIVGDTFNAYTQQAARRIPGNMGRAARVLKAGGRQDRARRTLTTIPAGKGRLKTGRYGKVTYEQAAENLAKAGAYRTGFTAKEIPELAGSGSDQGIRRVGRVRSKLAQPLRPLGRNLKQAALNREDLPRLTTAVEALRNGATWEQAASKVADTHFDYGHLTDFERQVARRAAPFYTWSARNIPLQAKVLVTRPGKFANYQKVREEAAKSSGVDEQDEQVRGMYAQLRQAGVSLPAGWEQYLSEWEQRNAGIPVSVGGHKFTISLGLPLQDLNELPGAAGTRQLNEYFQKAMSLASPIAKDPVEYFSNHSFFFRDQIEQDHSPDVSAPKYVALLPKNIQRDLGVTPNYLDKRTGKVGWGWPAKMDYLAKAIPGTPSFAQQLLTGTDRRGKSTGGKVLGFFGVKSVPFDPTTTGINLAYERMQEIQKQQSRLRHQAHPSNGAKIGAENPTPEYVKLGQQLKIVTQIAYQGKAARGDAVLPTQGGPPKRRVVRKRAPAASSSGGFFGGSSSSGSSSGSGSSSKGFF